MSWQQAYGSATALNPPVVVGGVSYGAAVVFNSAPGQAGTEPVIVAGNFDAPPTTPAPGRRTVICRRAMQQFSYTKVNGPRDAMEVGYGALMGGNVAVTSEPERGYSWNGERSFRGDDSHDRARPGDVLWWRGRGFLISDAQAFTAAPATVNWGGDEPQRTIWTVQAEPNDLRLDPPDRVEHPEAWARFDTTGTGPFHDCGLYVFGGGSYTALERVVYAEDEDLFPADAAMDPGQYWFDPVGLDFRLGTDTGPKDLAAVWFESGRRLVAAEFGDEVVLEGGGTGYGAADDALSLASGVTREDFVLAFYVYFQPGVGFGQGAIEWRQGLASDAAVIACEWAGASILRVWVREETGGELAEVEIDWTASATGTFRIIRITKTGGTFAVHTSTDGTTFDAVVTGVALTGVVEKTYGLFGVTAWDGNAVRVGPPAGGLALAELGTDAGELSLLRLKTWSGVEYTQELTLPVAQEIERVDNLTSGLLMLEGDAGRGGWSVSGGKLVLASETAGDVIRVTHEAAGSAPTPPGRPGRFPGAINFGTFAEDGETSTTVLGENRGNWRDVLTVIDLEGELAAIAGEDFEIRRNPRFDPLDPPDLHYSVRNGATEAWQALPEGAGLFRPVEGLVLLTEAFLATVSGPLCLRARGKRYSQAGNMQARQLNDLALAIEALDGLWVSIPTGAAGAGVGGGLPYGGINVGPSGTACWDCATTYSDAFDWGTTRSAVALFADNGLPGWYSDSNYYAAMGSISGYTTAANTAVVSCGSGCIEYSMNDRWTSNDHVVGVNPAGGFLGNPTAYNYFGAEPPNWQLGAWSVAPVFYVGSTALPIPDVVTRLPEGAVCVEAWAQVKVTGLQRWDWELEVDGDVTNYHWRVTVNDVAVQDYVVARATEAIVIDDSDEEDPVARTTGGIGFTLIGRRRRSSNVEAKDTGDLIAIAADDWRAFPGGTVVGGTAADGKWSLINVTNVIQGLINARASEYTEFFLWPGAAGVSPLSTDTGLTAYAKTVFPTRSATLRGTAPNTWADYSASGSWTTFTTLQIGGILAKFRLPEGTDLVLPLEQRPFAPSA